MATNTPLTFTAVQANSTIALNKNGSAVDLNLEFSTDGSTWQTFNVGTTYTLAGVGDYLILRAPEGSPNTQGTAQSDSAYHRFTMAGQIAASGNLMCFYDKDGAATTVTAFGLQRLFTDCSSLIEGPGSTATILQGHAYTQLFMGCTNLTSVGTFADAVASSTYNYAQTFSGCSSLTEVQDHFDIGVANGGDGQFKAVFSSCTSLTHAPSLRLRNGQQACLNAFQGCTSIVDAGDIICSGCSNYMFQFMYDGCSSLVTPPKFYEEHVTTHELRDAFVAASRSHGFLFRGCASMTSMPNFKITSYSSKADYGFEHLFDGCTSLVDASGWTPPSSYSSGAMALFQNLFDGCTSLKKLPKFPAYTTGNAQYGFQYAFRNCTSLERGADITVDYAHQYFFRAMYQGCTNLKHSGVMKITGTSSGAYNTRAFENLFNGCSKLTTVCTPMNGTYIGTSYSPDWLSGVPATGTVYYTGDVLQMPETRNASTIPTGWTIEKYTNNFRKFFIGGKEVSELFIDGTEVKIEDAPMALKGLAFKAKQDGSTVSLTKIGAPADVSLEYAVNGNEDEDFAPLALDAPVALDEGDVMLVRAPEGSPNLSGFCQTWGDGSQHHSFDVQGRVDMAGDITRLVQKDGNAGSLPAYCFLRMFTPPTAGQYGLEDCSEAFIPDVQLSGGNVFSRMFEGCSLTKAPRWGKVTLLGSNTCWYAFDNCFLNCANLVEAQDVFDVSGGRADYCFNSMFENCTSLLHGPALGSPVSGPGGTRSHRHAFWYCTAMTSAGRPCHAEGHWDDQFQNMFTGCSALADASNMTFRPQFGRRSMQGVFSGCTSLEKPPQFAGPPAGLQQECLSYMFEGCTSLTSTPDIDETAVPSVSNNSHLKMFIGCTSLSSASNIRLSETAYEHGNSCYQEMFSGCTALEEPPAKVLISAGGSFTGRCASMFVNCTSLAESPYVEVPATLHNWDLVNMFNGCSSLSSVTSNVASNQLGTATDKSLDWLAGVAPEGRIFVQSGFDVSIARGPNTVPEGWRIYVPSGGEDAA